jgi:hypothetical protein
MSGAFIRLSGRGAVTNAAGRFERLEGEAFDEGWEDDDAPRPLKTSLQVERARVIRIWHERPTCCWLA